MKRSVASYFIRFNEPFEGRCTWLYLDVKGLVTTGVGNLCDPLSSALPLPWRKASGGVLGVLATAEEIAQAWRTVKARQDMVRAGGGAFKSLTTIRLADVDVDALVRRKLYEMAGDLRRQFPKFDEWPADAQMGLLSVSWARGQHGYATSFPKLTRALLAEDFMTAADECSLKGGGTVRDRNLANLICFQNAALVLAQGMDRDALHYPEKLCPSSMT